MKVLIAYSSKYGSTRECAEMLAQKLDFDTDVIDVKKSRPDPRIYDAVIIGGPVYMGKLNKDTALYCELNADSLLTKPLGLFMCHMDRDRECAEQLSAIYPGKLLSHSSVSKCFGGAYTVTNMNFFYKMIIKKAAGVAENKKDIFIEEIDTFTEDFTALLENS